MTSPDPLARLRALAKEAAEKLHGSVLLNPYRTKTGHIDDGTVTLGFTTCPHPDCVLVRTMPEPIDTYTPILWATMTEEQRYEEYVRVRQLASLRCAQ